MRAVFGIDVSKPSSEMAILVNGEKVRVYTIPNDSIDFNHLLDDLKTVQNPENFFEVTGQPTVRKTDKIDTEKIALSQFLTKTLKIIILFFIKNYSLCRI